MSEATLQKTQFLMTLKREGSTAAHFVSGGDDEAPSAFKDGYMPIDDFNELGKPQAITVTIELGDKLNV